MLVKNEKHLDQFDQIFGEYFKGMDSITNEEFFKIPEEWMNKNSEKLLSPEQMDQIKDNTQKAIQQHKRNTYKPRK